MSLKNKIQPSNSQKIISEVHATLERKLKKTTIPVTEDKSSDQTAHKFDKKIMSELDGLKARLTRTKSRRNKPKTGQKNKYVHSGKDRSCCTTLFQTLRPF